MPDLNFVISDGITRRLMLLSYRLNMHVARIEKVQLERDHRGPKQPNSYPL
jgi:hypothetical protein